MLFPALNMGSFPSSFSGSYISGQILSPGWEFLVTPKAWWRFRIRKMNDFFFRKGTIFWKDMNHFPSINFHGDVLVSGMVFWKICPMLDVPGSGSAGIKRWTDQWSVYPISIYYTHLYLGYTPFTTIDPTFLGRPSRYLHNWISMFCFKRRS